VIRAAADEGVFVPLGVVSPPRRERIRDDYEHQLRADLEAAGLPVRPWPEGLTT